MSVTLDYGLLCDFVRREDNGKLIIVGAYSSNVAIPTFPFVGQFNLVTHISMPEVGVNDVKLRVLIDAVENHRLEFNVEVVEVSKEWVPILLQPLQFVVPGTLSIDYSDDGQNWKEFFKINVVRQPSG